MCVYVCVCPGDVCPLGCIQWVGVSREVYTHWTQRQIPPLDQRKTPPCGQTDICANITLPQMSFAGSKNVVNLKKN